MPAISVEAHVSPEALLEAVDQLAPAELDRLFKRVLALRAHHKAPRVKADEGPLLRAIGEAIPSEIRRRYDRLIERRRDGVLMPDEHEDLLRLGDQVEAIEARRVESLARLAQLRGVSLDALLDSLGIQAPEYE